MPPFCELAAMITDGFDRYGLPILDFRFWILDWVPREVPSVQNHFTGVDFMFSGPL